MKNRYLLSTCAATALSLATVAAQTPSQGTSPQAPVPGTTQNSGGQRTPDPQTGAGRRATAQSGAQEMTISGCVTRGTGTGQDYILTENGTDAAKMTRYRLMGDRGGDLSRYVGQRVEVVGTRDMGASGASAAGTTAGSGTAATGGTRSGTTASGTAGSGTTASGTTGSGTTASGATGSGTTASGTTDTNRTGATGTSGAAATGNTRDRQDTALATDPASGQSGSARAGATSMTPFTVTSVRTVPGDCRQ
jgi:hypothetical protein